MTHGIQAYFTHPTIAPFITRCIGYYTEQPESMLDMCAGSGNLTFGWLKEHAYSKPAITLVEPNQANLYRLSEFTEIVANPQIAMTTGEEFMLTHGKEDLVDLSICNPPFGKRCGLTQCNERVTELHLPDIARFETYFLITLGKITRKNMAFLIPEAYWSHGEAKPACQTLASWGWVPTVMRKLPVNSFESALVQTHLVVFEKTERRHDWSQAFLDDLPEAPPLFRGEEQTFKGRHEDIRGVEVPLKKSKLEDLYLYGSEWLPRQSLPEATARFFWKPDPKPQGSLWERQNLMYQLTPGGWLPANGKGYAEGLPVSPDFQKANTAMGLIRKGLIHTGYTILRSLPIENLRADYGKWGFGAFLNNLSFQFKPKANPLVADLKTLRRVKVDDAEWALIHSYGFRVPHRNRRLLYAHPSALLPADKASFYLQNPESVDPESFKVEIQPDDISLRAGWIPKQLVANYLKLKLVGDTFYAFSRYATLGEKSVVKVLNWSRSGSGLTKGSKVRGCRVSEADRLMFQQADLAFIHWLRDWDAQNQLKLTIIAYYQVTHQQSKPVAMPKETRPALPLKPYQERDLPFGHRGEGLVCYDVGLGKTFYGLSVAMGHPGPVLIVVPKRILGNWLQEARRFFPDARSKVLGFRFHPEKRDWVRTTKPFQKEALAFFDHQTDFLLTTYEVYRTFNVPARDQLNADLADAYAQIGCDDLRSKVHARARHIELAAERNFHNGGGFSWNDLPLANLLVMVDECHAFKGLFPMPGTGWGSRYLLVGNVALSKGARHMKTLLDATREKGGKTLGLTATPFTNCAAEVMNMLRVFAPGVLQRKGIHNAQEFLDRFAHLKSIAIADFKGEPKLGMTIEGFRNLETLQEILDEAIVMRKATDPGIDLPLPKTREYQILIDPDPKLQAKLNEERALFTNGLLENGDPYPIFKFLALLEKASVYPRGLGLDGLPKARRFVENALTLYHQGGNQIVFVDLTAAQKAYRDALIEAGIPRKEIAIVNGSQNSDVAARQKISEAFNRGTLRFVVGGKAICEGINLQKKTTGLHFLNLDWHHAAIHQKKGRAHRQGNDNDELLIFYYMLKDTLDEYRFKTIAAKKGWQDQIFEKGHTQMDTLFDVPLHNLDFIAGLSSDPEQVREVLREKEARNRRETDLKTYGQIAGCLAKQLEKGEFDAALWPFLKAKLEETSLAAMAGKLYRRCLEIEAVLPSDRKKRSFFMLGQKYPQPIKAYFALDEDDSSFLLPWETIFKMERPKIVERELKKRATRSLTRKKRRMIQPLLFQLPKARIKVWERDQIQLPGLV